MNRRLTGHDRDKLDQYLTGIREIETNIEKAERFGEPKDPGGRHAFRHSPGPCANTSRSCSTCWLLAFQTDSTRVATLLLGHDGDNRSLPEIGVSEGHHDLSHHFNNEDKIQKLTEIDLWYVQQLARFMQKMRANQGCRREFACCTIP